VPAAPLATQSQEAPLRASVRCLKSPESVNDGPSRLTIKYPDSRLTLMRSGEAAANALLGARRRGLLRPVDARSPSGTTRTVAVRREGAVSVLWPRRRSADGADPELGQEGRGRVGRWGLAACRT
jgi:hypothetical protein